MKLFLSSLILLNIFTNNVWAANPPFSKVMIVIFENQSYDTIISEPFFGKLASDGASLQNFHAEAHPSQGNYIALVSGDKQGVTGDGNVNLGVNSIVDLLEAKGKTWKAYVEAYPGNCFKGTTSSTYARKHNPFISFKNIQNSSARCANIVNASQLSQDISQGTLPDYSFYIPDMKNDGHDTGPDYADRWYSKTFGPLMQDSRFMKGMLLISTFDESALGEPNNHIYTVFNGEMVLARATSNDTYDHYSLLRTIEDAFGLGTLGLKDASATAVTAVFK